MKKILLVVAVASLAMVSCKKDYKCVCTVTGNGVTITSDPVTIHDTKSGAKDACTAKATTVSGVTSSCAIQ